MRCKWIIKVIVVILGFSCLTCETKKLNECVYNNNSYPVGETFYPDPCTICECSSSEGRPLCVEKECVDDVTDGKECLEYEENPREGHCCKRCLKRKGSWCVHRDGKHYPIGDVPSASNCERCYCNADSNHTFCIKLHCTKPRCVDSVKPTNDTCCPICPNGPNCRHGNIIIPTYRQVKIAKCKKCQCPSPIVTQSLRATCSIDCSPPADLRLMGPLVKPSIGEMRRIVNRMKEIMSLKNEKGSLLRKKQRFNGRGGRRRHRMHGHHRKNHHHHHHHHHHNQHKKMNHS